MIAAEKAGIIKKGTPVIIGENNPETRPVFEAKAKEMQAPIIFAEDNPEILSAEPTEEGGMRYMTQHAGELIGDLGGIYQQKNMNTVLYVLKVLDDLGFLSPLPNECYELLNGIKKVCSNTGLMGRWQIIQRNPLVVCDTGHNVGGWQYLSRQLAMVKCNKMHVVFGMVNDKDIDSVLELLPKHAIYYFTKANTPRALNEQSVRILAINHGLKGTCHPTVNEAYKTAIEQAEKDDFVFVGGSSYVVGDFLKNGF
jgi:dihydrofolate synthase/folylpolyglutamate synthase